MTDMLDNQQDPIGPGEFPALTIIIPAATNAAHVRRILTELAGQDYPKDKIETLVVDSRPPMAALAGEFSDRLPGLRLLNCESPHTSCARNLALKNSSAPYVLMFDERMTITSERYLQDVAATFLRSKADCICRPSVYRDEKDNLFARAVALASESYLGFERAPASVPEGEVLLRPCGAYYRRSVFDTIGAYDEAFDTCDDVDFNFRAAQAGCKRWSAPALKISRYAEDSAPGLWDRMFRLGSGRYLFGYKHRQYSLTHFLAPAGTLALALLVLFGLLSGFRGLGVLEFAFNIYAVFALITSALITLREKKLLYVFSLPVIFPLMHLAYGSGFLMAWFKDLRRRQKLRPAAPAAPAPPAAPAAPAAPADSTGK